MKRQLLILGLTLLITCLVGFYISMFREARTPSTAAVLDGVFIGCSQREAKALLGNQYEVVDYSGVNSLDDDRVGWRFPSGTLIDFVNGHVVFIEGSKLRAREHEIQVGQGASAVIGALGTPLEYSEDQIVYDLPDCRLFFTLSGNALAGICLEAKP